jgi:serine/threonine protein kinase
METPKDQNGAEVRDPLIGETILGQYRIVRPIAKGGMGQIYLAEQLAMDRYAAIKLLQPAGSRKSDMQERFRREARALSKLTHPNIITVYNFGELEDGKLFLAMEYVEGISLAKLVGVRPLPPIEALEITLQCADALAFAHQKKVIHRDFKPGNIMLTQVSGRIHVKVLDFGIARLGDGSDFTVDGALLGTPQYMSPEQCRGEAATSLADQYALGLVLYEMLTGRPAIDAGTPYGFLQRHQTYTPPPPSMALRQPQLIPLDSVVMRMQAKDPAERYPEMRNAFLALIEVTDALFPGSRKTPSGVMKAVSSTTTSEFGSRKTPSGPVPSISGEITGDTSLGLGEVELAVPHTGSTAVSAPSEREIMEPARLLLIGANTALRPEDWRTLEGRGFQLCRHCPEPAQLAASTTEWDVAMLVLPELHPEMFWQQCIRAGLRSHRTLVCLDASLESENLRERCGGFPHFMVTTFPADLEVLCIALAWLWQQEGSWLQLSRTTEAIQISSSAQKADCIDTLLEDARTARVRRPVLRALKDLADEMIMNAIFNAPVDERGRQTHADLDRAADITLNPGQSAIVRWAFGPRHITVAVRDPFGSLTPDHILAHITGSPPSPRSGVPAPGAGMGLRIMSRSAQHLLFTISSGSWCEVMGMVDRHATPGSARVRSLVVLQGEGQAERQVGRRLRLQEGPEPGYLKLEGEIDETSDLKTVFSRKGTVWLDLGEVNRINSVGIRKWLEAARFATPELTLVFERCSPAIVAQINMVPAFAAMGQVSSILAPYLCPSCGDESLELVSVTEETEGHEFPPARLCTNCGEALQFDELADEYFAFLDK